MLFLSLFLFSFLAQASPEGSTYVRFSDLKNETRLAWQKQAYATTFLHMKDGEYCTAVFVGPEGEALTNLHCLESCLLALGAAAQRPAPESGGNIQINSPKPGPFLCDAAIKPISGSRPEEVQIEIIRILGPGWLSPREKIGQMEQGFKEEFLVLMNQGYEGFGDLALIRLPRRGPCVVLSEFPFREVAAVANLAYPIVYRKEDDNPMGPTLFTLGTTLLWSQGSATLDSARFVALSKISAEAFLPFFFSRGLIMASTDAEGGASGSPLFDENGKLVALTRSTWKGESGAYVPWTTQAIDIVRRREEILSLVPDANACQ